MAPYNNAPESGTRDGRPTAGRGSGAGAPVGGALFVGFIALCALVISYNGIFRFAEHGGHEGSFLAHLFPVAYTLLLAMACWVSYLLRDAHPRERFWVDLALIPLLVLFAAAAMLLNNFQLIERVHQGVANVIVAVAPLAGLLVAFLLWMALRAHTRRRRRRGPAARSRPADDPTTVLHARAVVPPAETPASTAPPGEGEDAADRDWDWERDRWDDGTAATEPLPREDAPEPEAGPGDTTEADEDASGTESVPDAVPEPQAGEDRPESSAPAASLPRRSRVGHNPIRRAAEQVPVVPGAAAPAGSGPEPVVVVPDHLADEGFDHAPPPGDPASDEADAPPAGAPEARPAPEPARAPEPDAGREPEPGSRPGPGPEEPESEEPEPAPSARNRSGSGTEHDPPPEAPDGIGGTGGADEPDAPLWEPPEDDSDTGARVLSDYVPPVWTPPEESPPPVEEYREPETTPALDHDVGPEVRAAFRIGDMPPGAASPPDEPVGAAPEPGETEESEKAEIRQGDEEEHEPHGDHVEAWPPEPGTGSEPLPEAEDLPSTGDEDEEGERAPGSGSGGGPQPMRRGPRAPLEKRPMVLKPRRPPVTDFASGPPSRRVRSEPLRPDE
ncbi:DUF2637 domain-containing protein [Nocardiopsis quinghaiensis]|uniref:DUF2637 domain-containing protein n=1 Tax=Nocardiopsis quinghaiensis TaxID=464995 RepID=UPI00123999C7|nr:DUF2637 domain-containing protein [Nocardiopsis quinghaiensis]